MIRGWRRNAQPRTPRDYLSPRESDIARLLAKGLSNKQIADELSLSLKTVKNHLSRIYGVLKIQTRTQAVISMLESGAPKPEGVQTAQASPRVASLPAKSNPVESFTRRQRRIRYLTDREFQILRLVARGLANKQIGAALYLSEKTVKNHLSHAYDTLRVTSRVSAVVKLLASGDLTLEEAAA